MEVNDLRVDVEGEYGEYALEEGEEGRIIERPRAGLVGVPFLERERAGQSKPVAVDFEVCGVV